MKAELPFALDGVDGELKIVAGLLSFKFYQNGNELKKHGTFKPAFTVTTNSGTAEDVKVLNNPIKGYMVDYKGQRTKLQEKLTTTETIILFIPFVIFCVCNALFLAIGGLVGGVLIGATVAISILVPAFLIRQNKSTVTQLIIAVAVGVGGYLIYIGIGLLFIKLLSKVLGF